MVICDMIYSVQYPRPLLTLLICIQYTRDLRVSLRNVDEALGSSVLFFFFQYNEWHGIYTHGEPLFILL